MASKPYGDIIREAREAQGMTRAELAERLDQSVTTVQRLEASALKRLPSIEQVNALVSILHISAEELLRAMGVHLNPPAAARLPRALVLNLLAMDPEELRVIERIAGWRPDAPGPRGAQ